MSDLSFDERIEQFEKLISGVDNIVFFGGAGVSTGSGIPDFRSKDGLYNNMPEKYHNYEPEYLLSVDCFKNEPEVFYEFYRTIMNADGIEPNVTHRYLAFLEETGKNISIVTQNVDMLHEKAGSKNVYKIHGTTDICHCTECGQEMSAEEYISHSTEAVPKCPECGGILKPNVVLYGDMLPSDAVRNATFAIFDAQLLIVAGTSLKVEPAASMVRNYHGTYLVIVNNEPTPLDMFADIVFREDMSKVFEKMFVASGPF